MKKKSKRPFHVAFFGDAHIPQKDPVFVDAFDCSQLLAQKKCTILNGGGPGIMLASTLGAKSVQGRVELVVIDPKNEPKNNYEGQSKLILNTIAMFFIYRIISFSHHFYWHIEAIWWGIIFFILHKLVYNNK